jgi:hypothetical protein
MGVNHLPHVSQETKIYTFFSHIDPKLLTGINEALGIL